MISFGLLGGFCDHLEIRITGLSEEGFSFRVPEKIEKAACLEICFLTFLLTVTAKCSWQRRKER